MRTIVDIPPEQMIPLDALCKREEMSRAEAIRRAVAMLLASNKHRQKKVTIDDVFGIWENRADIGDAVEYQQRLRAEWSDHDALSEAFSDHLNKTHPNS